MSFLVPAFSTFSRQYFFFLSLPVCHDFIQCSNHTQLHVVLQLLCSFTTLSLGCDHPCLERPSFCLLGSFPPILETPVPNPFDLSGLIWKSLLCFPRGPHEYPCSSSCLSRLSWAWHIAGAQSRFVEQMNLKWSIVGRMKKRAVWICHWLNNYTQRIATCYLTTRALECPCLCPYICLLNIFIPFRAWVQIRTSPLSSCVA